MKDKKRDIIYMFIASLVFSALMAAVFIIFEQKSKLYLALIPQLVLALLIGIMYLQEKAIDNEDEKLKNMSGSKLRQQLLENRGDKILHSIEAETMAGDLKRVYRRKICPLCFGVGLILLPLTFFMIYCIVVTKSSSGLSGTLTIGLFGILGIIVFSLGIYHLFGLAVNKFIQKEYGRIDEVERSYMMGNMVCGYSNGINIGSEYCVYYDLFGVVCFRTDDIERVQANKQIIRRRDVSGFDTTAKKDISVDIKLKTGNKVYSVNLTVLQLEYVCDEFTRHGVKVIKHN